MLNQNEVAIVPVTTRLGTLHVVYMGTSAEKVNYFRKRYGPGIDVKLAQSLKPILESHLENQRSLKPFNFTKSPIM